MPRPKEKAIFNKPFDATPLTQKVNLAEADLIDDGNIKIIHVVPVDSSGTTITKIFDALNVVKSAQATAAGSTALWTPATTKRFNLLGGTIVLSKDAACAGAEFIELLDGATHIGLRWDISTAALVAIGACVVIPFDLKPSGLVSVAVGNVLNISLNGALTAGNCSVVVWGSEQ